MHMWRYLLLISLTLVACTGAAGEAAQSTLQGYTGYWVDVTATAYSPHDPIDGAYHATKGDRWRWITADGRTDVREQPYGIAVPNVGGKPWLPYGTQVIIPTGYDYLDGSRPTDRVFRVDDTGSAISKLHKSTGKPHIDLRYATHTWARRWRNKPLRIFVVTGVVVAAAADDYKNDLFYDPAYGR